jgi:hypothetical protein
MADISNPTTDVTIMDNVSGEVAQVVTRSDSVKALAVDLIGGNPKAVPLVVPLLNGSAKNMNVSGSLGTPVNFTYAPASGVTVSVDSLACLFIDGTTPSANKFGNGTALTNGLRVFARISNVDYEIGVLKDNADVSLMFAHNGIVTWGAGFWNDADAFQGMDEFHTPLVLNGTNGDYIRAEVRDNITTVDYLLMSAHAVRYL